MFIVRLTAPGRPHLNIPVSTLLGARHFAATHAVDGHTAELRDGAHLLARYENGVETIVGPLAAETAPAEAVSPPRLQLAAA